MVTIIDGKNLILGRLAGFVAKKISQENEEFVIFNAKKIVISGQKKDILQKYKHRRERGDPIRGPFFPRTVEGIVRRSIRGMLGFTDRKGKARFKLLKVYTKEDYGDLKNVTKVEVKDAKALEKSKYMTIEQLSKELGCNNK
ncbi:MAG: 50S ribosomal protein L13 [Candidatus Aenigmarchaeota archaeon]|nr:50S ribosomal protein L13 [Candidatus Aenigmarchaeota archaeon]